MGSWRAVAAPRGARQHSARPRTAPSQPRGLPGRGRLCRLGRQSAALRSRMGAGRQRRPGGGRLLLGDDFLPGDRMMANTWQGRFPWENLKADGYRGTTPVKRFPPNGYGLFEMTGNVWEWTSDFFSPRHPGRSPACCVPRDPHVGTPEHSYDRLAPDAHIPRRVVKGGSYLCAPNYCLRYRPAARQGQAIETSSTHIGFRCITRATEQAPA